MSNKEWDVVIAGGGPAGLTTTIMCGYRNLDTLVLEGGIWGGLPAQMYPGKNIPNYPGFPEGITGAELADQWIEHAQKSESVTLRKERVLEIDPSGQVRTEEASYQAKTIVIATGTRPRQLGIRGEAQFSKNDRGVYYYLTSPCGLFHTNMVPLYNLPIAVFTACHHRKGRLLSRYFHTKSPKRDKMVAETLLKMWNRKPPRG